MALLFKSQGLFFNAEERLLWCVCVLALLSIVLTAPVDDQAPLWNTDMQRTELQTNEIPEPPPRRKHQPQAMQGHVMLRPARREKPREKSTSPTSIDSLQDVILHQYFDLIPAMRRVTPPSSERTRSTPTNAPQNYNGQSPLRQGGQTSRRVGQSPSSMQQQHQQLNRHSKPANVSVSSAQACRLDSLLVTVRRGGCKKQVSVQICHGTCMTTVSAIRRPPFVQYRPTCCRAQHQERLMVDMNDDECTRQRQRKRKARLSGYSNIMLLSARQCDCAPCS